MRFSLTSTANGELVRKFEARDDQLAVENCKGYLDAVAASAGRPSEAEFRLEEDKEDLAEDAKRVGTVRLMADGTQLWDVVHRRYLRAHVDMSVGDPHDEAPARRRHAPAGPERRVLKQSRAART